MDIGSVAAVAIVVVAAAAACPLSEVNLPESAQQYPKDGWMDESVLHLLRTCM